MTDRNGVSLAAGTLNLTARDGRDMTNDTGGTSDAGWPLSFGQHQVAGQFRALDGAVQAAVRHGEGTPMLLLTSRSSVKSQEMKFP